MRHHVLPAALVATALVASLAGCTVNKPAGGATAGTISVKATDTSCVLSTDRATSGTSTFVVTNTGTRTTEFYILGSDRLTIIGEVENVAPGLSRTLTIQAQPGTYTSECKPGMAGDGVGTAAFRVTGKSVQLAGDVQQQAKSAASRYVAYVRDQASTLLERTTAFATAYTAGDTAKAKALYPQARSYYERIEPVAESFGDLDPELDAREPDVPKGTAWTGWHRIEKDLWAPSGYTALDAAGRKAAASILVTKTQDLLGRVRATSFTISASTISNGAIGLLDEVATTKITGEEESFSHTDLYDFQANVQGAEVAYRGLRDVVLARDAALADDPRRAVRGARCAAGEVRLVREGLRVVHRADEDRREEPFRLRQRPRRAALQAHRHGAEVVDVPRFRRKRAAAPRETNPAGAAVAATTETAADPGVSRRGLIRGLGVGALGAGVGAAAAVGTERAVFAATGNAPVADRTYAFYGTHQAGITTAAQDRVHFAAFDVADGVNRATLIQLLRDWTAAAARMTRGSGAGTEPVSAGDYAAPPEDTGEALGLSPAGLTITFGFGPSLFDDRFGLGARRPAALVDMPTFANEALVAGASDGDLCIQACSDDPQVAVHAIRNLSRIAFGRAEMRWSQLGFGRTSSTTRAQVTQRNLFGFKDGTANLKAEDTDLVDEYVWAGAEGDWMRGGSYLTVRKVQMRIEIWDRQSLQDQEQTFGRTKPEGAPLSGGTEYTALNFTAKGDGAPLIATDAHVRLAHPTFNAGAQLLRRGYNYADGNDALGRLNAGLLFIAFQRDPRKQFIPIQQHLAASDALNEYTVHVGSGMFAVPPGAVAGSYVGAPLFA